MWEHVEPQGLSPEGTPTAVIPCEPTVQTNLRWPSLGTRGSYVPRSSHTPRTWNGNVYGSQKTCASSKFPNRALSLDNSRSNRLQLRRQNAVCPRGASHRRRGWESPAGAGDDESEGRSPRHGPCSADSGCVAVTAARAARDEHAESQHSPYVPAFLRPACDGNQTQEGASEGVSGRGHRV